MLYGVLCSWLGHSKQIGNSQVKDQLENSSEDPEENTQMNMTLPGGSLKPTLYPDLDGEQVNEHLMTGYSSGRGTVAGLGNRG